MSRGWSFVKRAGSLCLRENGLIFFLVHEREGFFYRLPAKCYYLIHVQRRVVFKNNTTQCNFKTFCRWILGVFIHPVLIFFFNNVSFDIEFIVLQKLMYLRSTILWYLIIIISASSEQKNVIKRVNAYPYPYKN